MADEWEAPFSKEDFQELEKIRRDLGSVQKMAKETLQRYGIDKKSLKTYLSDPRNFTEEEWQDLQTFRGQVKKFKREILVSLSQPLRDDEKEAKLNHVKSFAKAFKIKKRKILSEESKKKKSNQDETTKKKRKKLLGFKRKWMQM